jgi:uncharacterized protein YprB with RNaseH-like and TPR domain
MEILNCGFKKKNSKDADAELELVNEVEISNDAGCFALIKRRTIKVTFAFPEIETLKKDLHLIYGIGSITATKLNRAGIYTVVDLLRHPRWQRAAHDLLKIIENRDVDRLIRYGASDFQLLSFFNPETIKFIDIETLGLYYIHPVFLVGVLSFPNNQGIIKQFLARSFEEEKAILKETGTELSDTKVIASFNGRSFDLPYLRSRMKYHGLNEEMKAFHVDLLRPARKKYRGIYPNCRLITLEKELLNRERIDDIAGAEIAECYYRYLDTGDRSLINRILDHNAQDLLSMAKLLGILTKQGDHHGA